MSIRRLITTPCTLILRSTSGEEDVYGNEKTRPEEVEAVCEIQKARRAVEEPPDEGELSDTHWTGFFLSDVELNTGDAVRVEGLGIFELVGDPWPVRNPRSQAVSHVESSLRRTAGAEDAS